MMTKDRNQLFHRSESESRLERNFPEGWEVISRKHLINTLNYVNFRDNTILINLKHKKYNKILSLHAKPQPALNNTLECLWTETGRLYQRLSSYEFRDILLTDGLKLILVKAEMKSVSNERITLDLPEICYGANFRKVRRHLCEGIKVQFIQNSAVINGSLVDFNAISFSVEVAAMPHKSFQWINPESPVYVIFKDELEILYSGECRIISRRCRRRKMTFVLKPLNNQIHRFEPKEFRSLRQTLSPSPDIIFRHPLTKKKINLKVIDLSGSGISVEEYHDNSVLLPGMIIPELGIEFVDDFIFRCNAQVVYRNEGEQAGVKCGLSILDMDLQDQARLSGLLHQAKDRFSYVCNKVDLDTLWSFFFKTGFVYPEKYAFIHADKERFRELYERLYTQNLRIARHFIYQDRGTIHGHMSMIRFYENTWIIHHHAASRSSHNRAGLIVLEQLGRYINDFLRLHSAHMDFIACYFRPDNRFPNRIFGGFVRHLDDPQKSSLDPFAHFHYRRNFDQRGLSGPWSLTRTKPQDLFELKDFYEHESGGLMLKALDLEPGMINMNDLSKEYQRVGLKRERHIFSLKNDGLLKAVIMVNVSDIGLNMSNLTNCIHVIVLNSYNLSREILFLMLSQLSVYYDHDDIPILLYPAAYAEDQSITCDKTYNLWVLDTQHNDHYFRYMGDLLCRIRQREKHLFLLKNDRGLKAVSF